MAALSVVPAPIRSADRTAAFRPDARPRRRRRSARPRRSRRRPGEPRGPARRWSRRWRAERPPGRSRACSASWTPSTPTSRPAASAPSRAWCARSTASFGPCVGRKPRPVRAAGTLPHRDAAGRGRRARSDGHAFAEDRARTAARRALLPHDRGLRAPRHIELWQQAVDGEPPDVGPVLRGVPRRGRLADLRLLARARRPTYPDAVVLLSTRDADALVDERRRNTIFQVTPRRAAARRSSRPTARWPHDMLRIRFTPEWRDETQRRPRTTATTQRCARRVPPERLVEWHPGDGWEPLCARARSAGPRRAVPAREHDRGVPRRARPVRPARR